METSLVSDQLVMSSVTSPCGTVMLSLFVKIPDKAAKNLDEEQTNLAKLAESFGLIVSAVNQCSDESNRELALHQTQMGLTETLLLAEDAADLPDAMAEAAMAIIEDQKSHLENNGLSDKLEARTIFLQRE